jgi:bifunctional non-homologous end joining protein LigD
LKLETKEAPLAEMGEIGPICIAGPCEFGLDEGLVSKRRDRPYRGRSKDWIKVKNRLHPAMSRVMEAYR